MSTVALMTVRNQRTKALLGRMNGNHGHGGREMEFTREIRNWCASTTERMTHFLCLIGDHASECDMSTAACRREQRHLPLSTAGKGVQASALPWNSRCQ